jgi:uncharacterized RDD family membrane protein YckC
MAEPAAMRYAGFWPRLGAMLVDGLVMAPFVALSFWAWSQPRSVALAMEIPLVFAFAAYNIFFVGRWGMTVGKCVFRIKVVSLGGERAGYLRAFRRHAVDFALSAAQCALTVVALMSVAEHEFNALAFGHRLDLLGQRTGAASDVLDGVYLAWALSELVVLLLNEKRRALHDYLAGTVVVHR